VGAGPCLDASSVRHCRKIIFLSLSAHVSETKRKHQKGFRFYGESTLGPLWAESKFVVHSAGTIYLYITTMELFTHAQWRIRPKASLAMK
jgi:hypothetical protein